MENLCDEHFLGSGSMTMGKSIMKSKYSKMRMNEIEEVTKEGLEEVRDSCDRSGY